MEGGNRAEARGVDVSGEGGSERKKRDSKKVVAGSWKGINKALKIE